MRNLIASKSTLSPVAEGLRRVFESDSGSVAVMVALSLTAILGMMALAIDVGQLRLAKQRLQMAADAAALAGALELTYCGGTADCSGLTAAAQDALTENGFTSSTLLTNCATGSTTALTVSVNNGPCALGAADPHNGDVNYVEVVVSQSQPTYFAGILGISSVPIQTRAEAALGLSQNCIYTLRPSGTDFLINGSGDLTAPGCGIVDDSSSSQALLFNGSVEVSAKSIGIVGNYTTNGSVSITPTPVTGIAPGGDPLASLTPPTFSAGSCLSNPNINGSGPQTLGPSTSGGTVCYNGISINGSPTVTLNPGLYIINGTFALNGSATISGTGVTFYFPPGGGSYTDNGSATLNVSAPTSGAYDGILFYQNPSDTQAMTFNGSSTSIIKGIFYAPSASLTLNGSNSSTFYTSLVVGSVTFNGSGSLQNYATINASSPLKSGAVLVE